MAIDGSTLDMPDGVPMQNSTVIRRLSGGAPTFLKLRFVAIAECGTHTPRYAKPGPSLGDPEAPQFLLAGPN